MRVLAIDDHPLIVSALQRVLRELDEEVSVVPAGSAAAAREALRYDSSFDLLLLDLGLPDTDGHAFLAEVRRTHPALPVVVVSASERSADAARAIDAGAMGYVTKRSSGRVLLEALRAVLQGVIVVPDDLLPEAPTAQPAPAGGHGLPRHALEAHSSLRGRLRSLGMTPRQLDVLELLLQGKPNKLIARELSLSVETVKDHVRAVLRTLNVTTRTQAVLAVSRLLAAPGVLAPWTRLATP